MKYADLISNDMTAGPGFSVTLFVQGCPHQCSGCFNPETWNFSGGKEVSADLPEQILKKIKANGIERRFCIMGGEPLCKENVFLTRMLLSYIKEKSPETELAVWTGYTWEELSALTSNPHIKEILSLIDFLVDGRFILSKKDMSLKFRGSSNQRIIDVPKTLKQNQIILKTEYYEKKEI